MAAMLAVKGSTSAYRYDRLSTLDQRSEHYGKPNSLLRPNTPGVPSNFKRVTHEDVTKVLKRAAAEPSAKKREAMLTDIGRNASAYEFDGDGSYVEDFALADNRIPLLNNIDGCPHDHMHTSMSSGTVSHEGYLQQYNNICIEKYYTLNMSSMPKSRALICLQAYTFQSLENIARRESRATFQSPTTA